MKKLILFSIFICSVTLNLFGHQYTVSIGKKIDSILQSLTIHEKISLLVGIGQKTYKNPLSDLKTVLTLGAAGYTTTVPRLGLTSVSMTDDPFGVRLYLGADDYKETFCNAFLFPIHYCFKSWRSNSKKTVSMELMYYWHQE